MMRLLFKVVDGYRESVVGNVGFLVSSFGHIAKLSHSVIQSFGHVGGSVIQSFSYSSSRCQAIKRRLSIFPVSEKIKSRLTVYIN